MGRSRVLVCAALALVTSAAFGADGWLTSWDDASKQSKKTGKPILANFTGSDWCSWCMKLKSEVFSTKEFQAWAAKSVVLLELDFPRKTQLPENLIQQNRGMQAAYGVTGFPTVVFLDADGRQLGKSGYAAGGAANWVKSADLILAAAGVGKAAKTTKGWPEYVKSKRLYAEKDMRGSKAPKLQVEKWLSGKAPSTKGKVIVLQFWASWCQASQKFVPTMNKLAKQFGKDAVFIALTDEEPEAVKEFLKTHKLSYHVAVDQKDRTSKEIGVTNIPHALVITPDGVVRWQGWPGDPADELTAAKLGEIIRKSKALAAKKK